MSNIKKKTTSYQVRKGYVIKKMPFEYLGGCIVELTDDEAKNKYSHQIEPVQTKNIDKTENRAIQGDDIKKKR